MAFKLIWSPSSRLGLKDITASIAEDSICGRRLLAIGRFSGLKTTK
jgi:hypothetical protein